MPRYRNRARDRESMIRAWTENRILREPVAEFCISHETV
jgi:hypothetical protein